MTLIESPKMTSKLTKAQREELRKNLSYLGLRWIVDDILDLIDERRSVAAKAERKARKAKP